MDHHRCAIDYAPGGGPQLSLLSRNLSRKWLYWTLAIVVAAAVWLFWPGLLKRGREFLAERKCLNYEAPAGQVVYDSDPAEAQVLLSQKDGYTTSCNGAAIYTPQCWKDWTRLQNNEVALFLPSMQSKNGPRLVQV